MGVKYTEPASGTVFKSRTDTGEEVQAVDLEQSTIIGATNETAASSDTATSGLNGRLQRIAQRLTSLIALLPSALVSGRLDVNLGAAPATVTVTGTVAHDSADSGNPQKIGAVARSYGSAPATVDAAGDRVNLIATRDGIAFSLGGHPNVVTHRYNTTGSQTNATVLTPTSGKRLVVTQAQVIADNANTAFPSVLVGFHASTTPTGAGCLLSHPGIPAGGGTSRGDGSGVLGFGAVDDKVLITCGAPTGGSLTLMVTYYEI